MPLVPASIEPDRAGGVPDASSRHAEHRHSGVRPAHQKPPAPPRNSPLRPRRSAPRRRAFRASSEDSDDDFYEVENDEVDGVFARQPSQATGDDDEARDSQGESHQQGQGSNDGADEPLVHVRAYDASPTPTPTPTPTRYRTIAPEPQPGGIAPTRPEPRRVPIEVVDETTLADALLSLAGHPVDSASRKRMQYDIVRGFMASRRYPGSPGSPPAMTLESIKGLLVSRQGLNGGTPHEPPGQAAEESRRVLLPLVMLAALRRRPARMIPAAVTRIDMLARMSREWTPAPRLEGRPPP